MQADSWECPLLDWLTLKDYEDHIVYDDKNEDDGGGCGGGGSGEGSGGGQGGGEGGGGGKCITLFVMRSASVISAGAAAGGHHGGLDLDAHETW